uniref:AIG1-type G domain-containing protein n=1 Tax=Panagrellus redivivus TaxID=6233 RepID=A0A7E4WAH0_PANRE
MSQTNILYTFNTDQPDLICSGGYETILHHSLAAKDVDNSAKVAHFLGLNKETFLNFSINRSPALEACLDFIDESVSRDFKAFVNVTTVCHVKNTTVYGNSYVIACNTQDSKLTQELSSKTPKQHYTPTEFSGACRVLMNFKTVIACEIYDFLTYLFRQNGDSSNQNSRKHIELGEFDENWQIGAPSNSEEMKSLTVLREAQRILKALCTRLGGESFEPNVYEGTSNTIESILRIMYMMMKKLSIESNPIMIRVMLVDIAKDLTALIQRFSYEIWELHCKKPAVCIQVPKTVVPRFYEAIKSQKSALPPVIVNAECKNSEITYHNGRLVKYVSVTCFEPLTDPFVKGIEVKDPQTFQHPCYCSKLLKMWLCSRCQEFLKVSNSGYIVCRCGKGDLSSMNLACLKEKCNADNLSFHPVSTIYDKKRNADTNVHLAQIITELSATSISKNKATSYKLTRIGERAKIIYETPPPQKPQEVPPGVQVYTVVVVGASGAGKSTLLNSIHAMQKHSDFKSASTDKSSLLQHDSNEAPPGVGQSVTQQPKDHLIHFENCVVRFVDTPGTNDTRGIEKDADNVKQIREFLMQLPEIHAVMFVVKNDECKLSPEFENTLRSLLGLFPRHALKNCCFINTFSAQANFQPGAVQLALQAFMKRFNDQHSLNSDNCLNFDNQFCVDNAATAAILDEKHRYFPLGTYEPVWNTTRNVINEFFKRLETFRPITNKKFKLASKMEQLGYKLIPHIRSSISPVTKRLMASIASTSVTGVAIYCRNRIDGATPLENREWIDAAKQWDSSDTEVLKILKEIDECVMRDD